MDTVAANGADEARSKGVANAERKGSRSRRWYSTGAARERTDEWVAGSEGYQESGETVVPGAETGRDEGRIHPAMGRDGTLVCKTKNPNHRSRA